MRRKTLSHGGYRLRTEKQILVCVRLLRNMRLVIAQSHDVACSVRQTIHRVRFLHLPEVPLRQIRQWFPSIPPQTPTRGDLRDRQLDGVRVGEQGVTIIGIGKGCPQLQILKLLLLGDSRSANEKIL
jgi:hypothetical protein